MQQDLLFPEIASSMEYHFPKPQYLGAKYLLRDWIAGFFPEKAKSALDGFGGTQSIAFEMKKRGLRTVTNDLLAFNHQIGLSLIENKQCKISPEMWALLFQENDQSSHWNLMTKQFSGLFFDEATTRLLDNTRWNIEQLSNPYQKALALSVMNRAMMRKTTMGHFAHTRALVYASDPERLKRNRSLARPIQELASELLLTYNAAVFDNGQDNRSYCGDVLELLPVLESVDFAYFDPPYCDSHSDYQSFYHLPETYTEYWQDKCFINQTKRYDPPRYSGFDKKRDVLSSFESLFQRAEHIPVWLISYNDRSYPKAEDLAKMIARYKNVSIEAKEYTEGRGGKGSVAGSREILFVCKAKTQINVAITWSKEMASFNHWKKAFDADEMDAFNFNDAGLLWLKIKSIARKELLTQYVVKENIKLNATKLSDEFVELYENLSSNLPVAHQKVDQFIRDVYQSQLATLDEQAVITELYKLRVFDWGGDYKNALDRYLVDRFVKVYTSYDELTSKFDGEISRAVQGYVLCSWYNHWSSIIIEHLFKKHPVVLPTVGQVKKVDFFVGQIPFDLKVTYLPANFIEKKRKELGLKPELTELKQSAKSLGILFNKDAKHDDVYYEITQKMLDRGSAESLVALESIKKTRLDILRMAQQEPKMLIQNLYEEQGEIRFDASNRLFLVLVDSADFDNSWKLKRNMDLLEPAIKTYLDKFSSKQLEALRVDFRYKTKSQVFSVLSDIIFVVK